MSVSGSNSTRRDFEKPGASDRAVNCWPNAGHVCVCRNHADAVQVVYGVHQDVVKEAAS